MNLAIPDVRTLEVHPATFSYLTTSCRRSSELAERIDLGVPLLLHAVHDASLLGYNFLALAGDQSLFHPGLAPLCREAHQQRMLTTLTTRTGLLNARRLKALVRSIDLLGIRYEAAMARALELVHHSGIPFALVFRLTRETLGELEAAASFAAAQGAAMLDIEPAGDLADSDLATVWMIVECLRDLHRGNLAIQLEMLNRYTLPLEEKDLDAWQSGVESATRRLGEVVTPLVIDEDGTVVPLRKGLAGSMAWGNLHRTPLKEMAAEWIGNGLARFCEVYRKVLAEARREGRAFGDLHQMLASEAAREKGIGFSGGR